MNQQLKNSIIPSVFNISSDDDFDPALIEWKNKIVRYKNPGVNEGSMAKEYDIVIKHTQYAYNNDLILRGYYIDRITHEVINDFGTPVRPEKVYVV